jgi:hypothetical protein
MLNESHRDQQALAQFGFDDLRIREALLMCDNDQEKAAQYLMNT